MTSLDVDIIKSRKESSVGPIRINYASVPCNVSSVVSGSVGEISIPKDRASVGSCGCAVRSAVGGATVVSGCICEIPGETVTE